MPLPPVSRRIARAAAVLAPAAGLLVAAFGPAAAVTRFQRSVYSAFNPADCEAAAPPAEGARAYLCPGLPGYPVYYVEANGRVYLGLGTSPQWSKSATQTLSVENALSARASRRVTIEWRVSIRNGRNVPYAAIVRAFTSANGDRGQVLVVYKIAGSEACHDAYVDALANAQPIVLAHAFADEAGRAFDCSAPARILGATGKSPM